LNILYTLIPKSTFQALFSW